MSVVFEELDRLIEGGYRFTSKYGVGYIYYRSPLSINFYFNSELIENVRKRLDKILKKYPSISSSLEKWGIGLTAEDKNEESWKKLILEIEKALKIKCR